MGRIDKEDINDRGKDKMTRLKKVIQNLFTKVNKKIHNIDEQMDNLKDAFFEVDSNWKFIYINSAGEKLLLRSKDELIGKNLWEEFGEAAYLIFYQEYNKAMNEQVTVEFQEFYPPLNTWFDVTAYPSKNGLFVHFRDVTESKKRLDESQEYYKSLFYHHPDAVFSFDLHGNFLSINKSHAQLFGYSVEETTKMHYATFVVPEDIERTNYHFQQAVQGIPQNYEITCLTKEGNHVEVNVTNVPIIVQNRVVGVYGIAKDITKQKEAEQTIIKSESTSRLAMKIAKLGAWEWKVNSQAIFWSDEMYRIVGIDTSNKMNLQKFLQYVHPEDKVKVRRVIFDIMQGKPENHNYRIVRPDGQIRYIQSELEAFYDQDGNIEKIIGISRDITDQKFAQQKLQKSEDLYKLISQNVHDVISYSDGKGVLIYISPSIRKLLGYEPDELIGQSGVNLLHPEDFKWVRRKASGDRGVFMARYRHKNGHYVWVERSFKNIKDENGNIINIIAIGRDITERVQAQEDRLNNEKLIMTGQLAAGIAHELKTPLTAIKGFFQIMDNENEWNEEYIGVIKAEMTRIENILSELLLLAKPMEKKFKKENLYSIVKSAVTLFELQANKKGITFVITFETNPIYIHCNKDELKQVMINLLKNGLESMENGGEIHIKANKMDNEVSLRVTDQGKGIPKNELKNLFLPFYTTKDSGTGLGLTVSQSIVERHHGVISVASEPNEGTTFSVSLPLTQ
ncbi:two-component system sporulation sensor kinase A [Salirhabdus euzebyi]|uniref:histidine kinase n=1 Tax=Salirhabdus euzebyi TaxID=394506 RepID=A0A841Q2Z7_9BACI|nr:PAS domain S-box protein [Salirhabdus euzebyi]MBB6452048.1 two-component system sporulation sensor kinase A [Salirhabdus euzebyi]